MLYNINFSTTPEVTRLGRMRQSCGWEHKGRFSSANILLFVISGEGIFHIDGRESHLTVGDCLLIPHNIFYTATTKEECEYYFIHFMLPKQVISYTEEEGFAIVHQIQHQLESCLPANPFKLISTRYDGVFLKDKITLGHKANSIWHMVTKCNNLRYERSINNKLQIDICFAQLLMELSTMSVDDVLNERPIPSVLLKIILYIQQNYHSNITLEEISHSFQLSKQYIVRLFKQHLNTTVTSYINSLKLFHSLELLKYSTMNIGEVAASLGFNNAYYFSRLFKRAYLLTPSEYIQSELNCNLEVVHR